jgi:DNA-directed RNA polymerase specialized sigma24 family protein
MTHEINLQFMTVEDLAQKCAQETKLYFNYLTNDTKYCFELFRRAISERSNLAWKAIIVQYKPSVARWVNRWADKHPDFPLAREEEEDFINEAFIRFWNHFTTDKFGKAQGLDDVLKYLKMCVNSAILDIWRKMQHRQFDQKLESNDDGEESAPVEPGPTPEELVQNDEIWQLIQSRLKDKKEYTVVYASFHLALSPRQIIAEYPNIFQDINEVYQCKANVLARLARDPELRKLLNLDD